jgi:1-acyl-sn-glycerol-3-phosphate acyltransferase
MEERFESSAPGAQQQALGESHDVRPALRKCGAYGFLSRLSAWGLGARGWTIEVNDPLPEKCVIVMYPHTSNWDFVIGLATKWAVGLSAKRDALCFAGKESLFVWPWGAFFRAVGGFPVKRSGGHGFVEQMASRFAQAPRMRFVLAPEGTRSYVGHMRSSFYYVAKAAKVPILLGAFDFAGKRVIVTEVFATSDDATNDLQRIDAYYRSLAGPRGLGHTPKNAAPWVFQEKTDRATR